MPFVNILLVKDDDFFKPFLAYLVLCTFSAIAAWLMPFDTAQKNLDNFQDNMEIFETELKDLQDNNNLNSKLIKN